MSTSEAASLFAELHAEQGKLRRRLATIDLVVDGLLELYPELSETQDSTKATGVDRPRGQDAVLRILKESPGRWFTVAMMIDALTERGWMRESRNPNNAIRVSMTRLAAADDLVQRRDDPATGAVMVAVIDPETESESEDAGRDARSSDTVKIIPRRIIPRATRSTRSNGHESGHDQFVRSVLA